MLCLLCQNHFAEPNWHVLSFFIQFSFAGPHTEHCWSWSKESCQMSAISSSFLCQETTDQTSAIWSSFHCHHWCSSLFLTQNEKHSHWNLVLLFALIILNFWRKQVKWDSARSCENVQFLKAMKDSNLCGSCVIVCVIMLESMSLFAQDDYVLQCEIIQIMYIFLFLNPKALQLNKILLQTLILINEYAVYP
jgi:hypothetical protein